jgi:hypothetical protein
MTGPFGPATNPYGVGRSGWALPADQGTAHPFRLPLATRLKARLLAERYDRQLAAGATAPLYSALEVHACRLITVVEREVVARSLRAALQDACALPSPWTARSWTHRPNVLAGADLIDTVTLWLHSPRPVTACGMARLRLLLSDGMGPLYVSGRGDLSGRLREALAVM